MLAYIWRKYDSNDIFRHQLSENIIIKNKQKKIGEKTTPSNSKQQKQNKQNTPPLNTRRYGYRLGDLIFIFDIPLCLLKRFTLKS